MRRRFAASVAAAYDGSGAEKYGGRWNSVDVRVAYASATVSLAALELRVHSHLHNLASDYVVVYAEIPHDAVTELSILPRGWNELVPSSEVAAVGDEFVRTGRALALAVPSVVIPSESNYLINPRHPDMARVRFGDELEPLSFDMRLFRLEIRPRALET